MSWAAHLNSSLTNFRAENNHSSWDESQPGNIKLGRGHSAETLMLHHCQRAGKCRNSLQQRRSRLILCILSHFYYICCKKNTFKQFILFKICWSSLRYKLSSEKWDNVTLIVHFKSCVICNSEVNNLFFQHLSQILLFWEPCTIMTVQSRCC